MTTCVISLFIDFSESFFYYLRIDIKQRGAANAIFASFDIVTFNVSEL